MKKDLNHEQLQYAAGQFAGIESKHNEPTLYGVTDGKAIGTYFEHKFQGYLKQRYICEEGNSARGIDFPELKVDMKVTSIKQPQSSCPFKSARQKIFGLGYALLVFVYDKHDNESNQTGRLDILHTVFVSSERTADWQTTTGLLKILENDGNQDDILAFLQERMLPVEEIEAQRIAQEIINKPPKVGYLTISNALQWRLQYSRIIKEAGSIEGLVKVV